MWIPYANQQLPHKMVVNDPNCETENVILSILKDIAMHAST